MNKRRFYGVFLAVGLVAGFQPAAAAPTGGRVRLVERAPDPYGLPRPVRDARDVPLRTSLYFELEVVPASTNDPILPESVAVQLSEREGTPRFLVQTGRQFAAGCSGWLRPRRVTGGLGTASETLAVYVEPGQALKPGTTYTVLVAAMSRSGLSLAGPAGAWRFTTETEPVVRTERLAIDLTTAPVRWRGRFFSGFCNVVFCTAAKSFGPTDEMMAAARENHPGAWSLQRDIWLTSTEDRREPWMLFMAPRPPNLVRERETRHILAIAPATNGVRLTVEDVFGHAQYGIPANRPVSEDYHPGDEVTVADGAHSARARVVAVDDAAGTVTLDALASPPGGWLLDYQDPEPKQEDPDAPGLFRAGGGYLRKHTPAGTACYYWGRLDKEFDLAVRRFGRRLVVNFCEAPADLSADGRNWTTAKDYAQWHEAVRTITGHLVDRYGERALDFVWSVFNEPDLGAAFWRADWDELQRFYDYTADAILRAFEDRGFDSNRVSVGGLELGAIFGPNLKLTEFLAHCSPSAEAKGAIPLNAAFADSRLEGKRSRRVEALCGAHDGRGSPLDFISVHTYNRSEVAADKLIRAKQLALEIDPVYYSNLWVNSHESCPNWAPPPDPAAADSYLGNGYYPAWCADVIGRQLRQAAGDARYAFGETILTTWPPAGNFAGLNVFTRILSVDDDGDRRTDRTLTVPCPIFHALNLVSDMGPDYWPLPERQVGGHRLGGWASPGADGALRVAVYAHHMQDVQSRSEAAFDVALQVDRSGWTGLVEAVEYRFDRDHNTYFAQARALLDRPLPEAERVEEALRGLESPEPKSQRAALETLEKLLPAILRRPELVAAHLGAIMALTQSSDSAVRQAAESLVREAGARLAGAGESYSSEEVEDIRDRSMLRPSRIWTLTPGPDGALALTVHVAGNGLNLLVFRPAGLLP
jgi:hypothetical protein